MRKLMWFTVGTMFGIAAGIWLLSGSTLWILSAVFGGIGLLLCLLAFRWKGLRWGAVIALGMALGLFCMFSMERTRVLPERALDGTEQYLGISVSDYAVNGEFATRPEGSFLLNGKKTPVTVYIAEHLQLEPGDRISGFFSLHFYDYPHNLRNQFHQGEIVMLLASAKGKVSVYRPVSNHPDLSVAGVRKDLRQRLLTLFPEDTAGFAVALLLGDSTYLNAEDDSALQNSGIRHIIAVSGLHVSMLFGVVSVLAGKRKRLCAMVGIPLLFVFAAIAGFTPSVLRACFMQAILLVSYLSKREYDPLTSLSAAVLIILLMNPLALTSISFQLSSGCVLGIILYAEKLYGYFLSFGWVRKRLKHKIIGRIIRTVAMSFSISLCAMLFTLPVSACYFGVISTVSALTNLCTLWLVTYIFCSLPICYLMGAIYTPIGVIFAQILSVMIRAVLWIAGILADIPYASIDARNIYLIAWLVLAYGIILLNLFLKKKKPLLSVLCISATLCIALLLNAWEGRNGDFSVTVLDVGQGQCVILQSRNGCYVVDCGGTSGAAAADLAAHTLKNQGISHVNGVILTHYDQDHSGGVLDFMSQMNVDSLYLPNADPENTIRLELESAHADKIQWIGSTRYLDFGEGMLTLYPAPEDTSGNESSMCILFQWEECDILIAGDMNQEAEQRLMQNARLPRVDVLIVGHHGSGDATSMAFLEVIRPGTAVISVGSGNRFGHPTAEVLTRLHIYQCRILRTDLHGTIVFKG